MPVAFMMGIPYEDTFTVAELIGTKLFLNEFVAYEKLSALKTNRLNGLDEIIGGQRQWISVSTVHGLRWSVQAIFTATRRWRKNNVTQQKVS